MCPRWTKASKTTAAPASAQLSSEAADAGANVDADNVSATSPGEETPPRSSSSRQDTASFFSRLIPGLRARSSRTRHFADFHIRPAEPHRKYFAGDRVQGAVILVIVRPVRITHLTVALHGYVRVYKNPSSAQEPVPFNPAQAVADGPAHFQYRGNGHASLFQDEQVLSADGRLEPGQYEFNFDLVFPPKDLPSSIDFERGTISYMITATLTRPTQISPTATCERKIYLVERVDVGSLAPPRPRTISLEPISKRSRRKKPVVADKGPATADGSEHVSDLDSARQGENTGEGSVVAEEATRDRQGNSRSPIQSDLRSEVSGDSIISGSTGRSARDYNYAPSATSSQAHGGLNVAMDERTIKATISLPRGGTLPGDIIPVKISVQHIKRIKSMHGVIVTLYRQGRIDYAPPASMFANVSGDEARKLEKEEYFPKSKTGLGGLSLTSAGSCSVFRKDLCQAFSPLIINPATMGADVTASVRVPEDAFPSIRGVPGEMISFKYQLEVIVDLGGKLANQIQGSGQTMGVSGGAGVLVGNNFDESAGQMASWSSQNIVDTTPLRREKGVISVVFEIIVGTFDSKRRSKHAVREGQPSRNEQAGDSAAYDPEHGVLADGWGWEGEYQEYHHDEDQDPRRYPHEQVPYPPPPHPDVGLNPPYPYRASAGQPSAPQYILPPELPDERDLSEKERVRLAEQRLLPSQPPGAGSSTVPEVMENIYDADDLEPSALPLESGAEEQSIPPNQDVGGPSAPTLAELTSSSTAGPTDDKRELERQRLLAEASAPPECPEDYEAEGVNSSSSRPGRPPAGRAENSVTPSAPTLTEEDQYGGQYAYGHSSGAGPSNHSTDPSTMAAEPLPKYER